MLMIIILTVIFPNHPKLKLVLSPYCELLSMTACSHAKLSMTQASHANPLHGRPDCQSRAMLSNSQSATDGSV